MVLRKRPCSTLDPSLPAKDLGSWGPPQLLSERTYTRCRLGTADMDHKQSPGRPLQLSFDTVQIEGALLDLGWAGEKSHHRSLIFKFQNYVSQSYVGDASFGADVL
jgi:hypothetical protein